MAANRIEPAPNLRGALKIMVLQEWPNEIAENMPCRLNRLWGVERALAGNAFSPACDAFRLGLNKKHSAVRDAPKAGFKRSDQRHSDFTERDLLNSQLRLQGSRM